VRTATMENRALIVDRLLAFFNNRRVLGAGTA
jgi:hypothetical protein